jgi:hypothetical protein
MSHITSQIVHLALDAYGDRMASVRGHVSDGDELDAMRAALEVAEAAWMKSNPEHQTDMLLARTVLNQVVVPGTQPAESVCSTCAGSGASHLHQCIACKECDGSGWVADAAPTGEQAGEVVVRKPCELCFGRGERTADGSNGRRVRCKDCEGTGQISRHTQPRPVGVPDGWKIVPIEPTPEMLKACDTVIQGYGAKLTWGRMVSAVPEVPHG